MANLLQQILIGRFGKIVRAKGLIQISDAWVRFDVADGRYGILGCEGLEYQSVCVLIGREIKRESVGLRFQDENYTV